MSNLNTIKERLTSLHCPASTNGTGVFVSQDGQSVSIGVNGQWAVTVSPQEALERLGGIDLLDWKQQAESEIRHDGRESYFAPAYSGDLDADLVLARAGWLAVHDAFADLC